MAICDVCFRHCHIEEGALGFCGARTCRDGEVVCANYGRVTALALDPIEKKPLAAFYPGSMILSVGSYGCNLRCPFCQNHDISWSETALAMARIPGSFESRAGNAADAVASATAFAQYGIRLLSPEDITAIAESCRKDGNIGVAFTYNEPLIGYEFVRDTARLVKERGMKNVLVTNGTADLTVLEELLPYIDAMNIDLKGFGEAYYKKLDGSLDQVKAFIARAVRDCHVEITTLIVPGENDTDGEMRELSAWISQLETGSLAGAESAEGQSYATDASTESAGRGIPLHISRFFPRFHMTDRPATDVALVYHLADVARENLDTVLTGNC